MADGSDPYSAGGYAGYGNTNKLLATAGNGPDAMNGWLTAARQGQALQQGQVQLSQQDYDLATARTQGFAKLVASAGANPTQDNLTSIINEGVQNGLVPQDMAQRALSTTAGMNDQQRQQWLYQHLQQLGNYQQQLDANYGAPVLVNQGGKLGVFMQKSGPQGGYAPAPSGVASIPMTVTPGDKMARYDTTDSTGAKTSYSGGQIYDSEGNFKGPPSSGPNAPPAPQGGAASAVLNPPRTVQPVQPQNQPTASPGASGGLTTQLSPGQTDALGSSGKAWSALNADVASPSGVALRVNMLQNALSALRGSDTGLGTAGRQKIMSFLANLPGASGFVPADVAAKLNDRDLADKYLTAYSLNTPGAVRSDAGMATAGAANASTTINPGAAQEVTLNNLGLERMKQAQAQAFIKEGQDPGNYTNWSGSFIKNLDPKAFALGDMTPQERASYYSTLKGKALTNFNQSVRVGIKTGILDRSDLAGATGGQ